MSKRPSLSTQPSAGPPLHAANAGPPFDQPDPAWPVCASRIALIAASLAIWFQTQAMLAARNFPQEGIGDALLRFTDSLHDFLLNHPAWADGLLVVSSIGIDALGIFLLWRAAFGPTIRPFLGLLILFVLRQICQGLVSLPEPRGMIWRDPGFPTLLVTYGTSTDLFFSAHTGLAVFGATELARLRKTWVIIVAIALAVFEMAAVIVLRAHYTMDVFTGAVAALWVASFAGRLAAPVDRALARLALRWFPS